MHIFCKPSVSVYGWTKFQLSIVCSSDEKVERNKFYVESDNSEFVLVLYGILLQRMGMHGKFNLLRLCGMDGMYDEYGSFHICPYRFSTTSFL